MSKGITSIEVTPSWGQSPARTRRRTGEVFINEDYLPTGWKLLPNAILKKMLWKHPKWKFILLHEEGHIVLNTANEDLADAYASRKYFAEGGSHRKSVKALSEVLPMNTPQHHTRLRNQVARAAIDDCKRNKHKPSCMLAETITGVTIGTVVARGVNTAIDKAVDHFSSFTGYDPHSVNAERVASVGIGEGVSVFDEFTPVNCGSRPVPAKCDKMGPLKRRRCNDGNKNVLDAWNKCNAQNNAGLKAAADSKALEESIKAENMKAQLSADTALKMQLTQVESDKAALSEETKQQAQSKTPMVIIIIAIIAGLALTMFFLFKSPTPKAA